MADLTFRKRLKVTILPPKIKKLKIDLNGQKFIKTIASSEAQVLRKQEEYRQSQKLSGY